MLRTYYYFNSSKHFVLRDKIRMIELYLCIYKRGKSEDTLLQFFEVRNKRQKFERAVVLIS